MKWFMTWVNAMILVISLVAILALLIAGVFGIAWLCVIPAVYSCANLIAIHKEEDEK